MQISTAILLVRFHCDSSCHSHYYYCCVTIYQFSVIFIVQEYCLYWLQIRIQYHIFSAF